MRSWLSRHGSAVVFYVAATLMLFWELGLNPLWASEDRWAEIARNMWLTGDWFHPAINGVVYFDKPLLSYWPIALGALLCGFINEFLVRLPSALAALAALWATRDLARQVAGERVRDYAGWLLLSSYGFFFWGRTAAADMLNLAVVVLAVDWFFRRRDTAGFGSYFLFYLICFAGALAKGLPAVILPPAVVLVWAIADGSWKKHLKWSHFLAIPPACALALGTFVLAAYLPMVEFYQQPEHGLSGLELVWRENVLRVFQPFDHDDEPFFIYLVHVPRIMAPWVLALLGALIAGIAGWKKLSRELRWLWLGSLVIFVLFSLSGSRRWYYILPIMPFLSIAVAEWMANGGRWNEPVRKVYRYGGMIMAGTAFVFGIAGLICCQCFAGKWQIVPRWAGWPQAVLFFALVLALFVILWKFRDWRGVLWGGAVAIAAVFSVAVPAVSAHRTEKPFALELKRDLAGVPPERMVFFRTDAPKLVYYMELTRPVRIAGNVPKLREYLEFHRGETVYLITKNKKKHIRELKAEFPELPVDAPWKREQVLPLERADNAKLVCWKYAVPAEAKGKSNGKR